MKFLPRLKFHSLDEIQIMCDKVPCMQFLEYIFFILFNLPISHFSLELRYFVCTSHFKFSSIMTPRNLVSLTRLITSPFRVSNIVPSLGTLLFLLGVKPSG